MVIVPNIFSFRTIVGKGGASLREYSRLSGATIVIKDPEETKLDLANLILPNELVLSINGSKSNVLGAARAIFLKLFGGAGYSVDHPTPVEASGYTDLAEPVSKPPSIYMMRQMQQIASQPPPPAPLQLDNSALHTKAVDIRVLIPFPLSAKLKHGQFLGRELLQSCTQNQRD